MSLSLALLRASPAGPIYAQEEPRKQILVQAGIGDSEKFARIASEAGVVREIELKELDAEVRTVPRADAADLLTRLGKEKSVRGADYAGDDYRFLFLPTHAQMALDADQADALQSEKDDPALADVSVLRLRTSSLTNSLLVRGLGIDDNLPDHGSLLLDLGGWSRVVATRKDLTRIGSSEFEWSGAITPVPENILAQAGQVPSRSTATGYWERYSSEQTLMHSVR